MNGLAETLTRLGNDALVLFAMVNAVGNMPVFAELTHHLSPEKRAAVFRKGVLVGGGIVIGFASLGNWLLGGLFQVSPGAFEVAGRTLVFAVAARGVLLGARRSTREGDEPFEDLAVFPLGFPFLAGPGTIMTTILLLQADGHLIATSAAVIVYASVLPLLWLVPLLERAIGRVAVLVVARVLYIFIAAKAVAFVAGGLRALWP